MHVALVCDACGTVTIVNYCSQVHIQADIVNYCQLHVVRSNIALFCDYCSQVHVRATVALLSTVALH